MQTTNRTWPMTHPQIISKWSPEDMQPSIPLIDFCLDFLSSDTRHGWLFAAKARDLSYMRLAAISPETPLQVIAIPSESVADLQQLATAKCQVLNRHSIDLMNCRSFLSWSDGHTQVEGMDSAELWGEPGHILRLFVTKKKVILVKDVFDDDFLVTLQTAHASSGHNYHPHRIWSHKVLAEAAIYASENSLQGQVFGCDEEENVLWLMHGEL